MMARIIDFCIIFSKLFPRSKSVSVFYVYLCTIFIHDMKYENTFKAIDQILWKEQGCGSELDYLEQKSWMLFLKYLDDLETEREEEAELEGRIYKRLVTGYYRWSQWAAPKRRDPQTGKMVLDTVNAMSDAKERLQMSVADIRAHYFELQRRLYCA